MLRRLVVLVCTLGLGCGPAPDAGPSDRTDDAAPTSNPAAGAADAPTPPSRADVPATGRPRVVFLGTSLTAGLGLSSPDDTYVARVAELADSAGLPIDAVNAGVSGETSAGGLRRLDWVLREPLDLLVVELGANDGLRGQDPEALADNLTAIIERTRARYPGTPVVLAGMQAPPNLGASYTDAFQAVFPRVAARYDAVLVPFLLEGVAGVTELNQADGIHPTPEGHQRMARTLWPHLELALRSLPAPAADGGAR